MLLSPRRKEGVLQLTFCDAAMAALAISINLLPPFLTTLSNDLGGAEGLSGEQLGRIGAVTFAGLVAGILLGGPLADGLGKGGPRTLAVGGNLLTAVGLVLLALAPGYGTVLAASFVMGVGAGGLDMILSPIVSALRPAGRTVHLNLLHAFYFVGAVATILLATLCLKYGVSWRVAAWVLVPFPTALALVFAFLPLPALTHDGVPPTPLRELVRGRVFVLLMAAIFLGGATEIGIAYWLPAYAERTLGFSKTTAGWAFLAFSVAMMCGRLGVLLIPKARPLPLLVCCCVGTALLFPVATYAPSPTVCLAFAVMTGITGSCLWPSTLALAADLHPRGGATMFGALAALGNLGGIFMPWLIGVLEEPIGLRHALALSAVCPVLMVVCLVAAWRLGGGAVPNPPAVSN